MATTATGMLLASKNGDISAAKLISETANVWVLEVEKREVKVSKKDTRQRAFRDMTEALEWAEAEPELIANFVALMASKSNPDNQLLSLDRRGSEKTQFMQNICNDAGVSMPRKESGFPGMEPPYDLTGSSETGGSMDQSK